MEEPNVGNVESVEESNPAVEKLSKKEKAQREQWLNFCPPRREIFKIMDNVFAQWEKDLGGVMTTMNSQTLIISGLKRILVSNGLFTEDQLREEIQQIMEEARQKRESNENEAPVVEEETVEQFLGE